MEKDYERLYHGDQDLTNEYPGRGERQAWPTPPTDPASVCQGHLRGGDTCVTKRQGNFKLNYGLNRWAISRTMAPGGALTTNRKLETAVIMSRLPRQLESLARMLSYILSHRPDEFGLVLTDEGFIPIKHLLQALSAESGWGFVRRHHLDQVVGLISPPAFEVVGEQIRALTPGPVHLRRPAGEPPPVLLYTAIPPKAHARVWEEGLKPPSDRDLVLAATPELALKLGRRRAPNPILVTVQAQAADRRGVSFTGYGEGLYLAPALPREVLQLPPPPPAAEKPKPEKPQPPVLTPGTFTLDLPGMFQPPTKDRGKGRKDEPAWKSGTRALRKQREKGGKKKGRKG
jgi:putative RNA 2'-phosphotransferase